MNNQYGIEPDILLMVFRAQFYSCERPQFYSFAYTLLITKIEINVADFISPKVRNFFQCHLTVFVLYNLRSDQYVVIWTQQRFKLFHFDFAIKLKISIEYATIKLKTTEFKSLLRIKT